MTEHIVDLGYRPRHWQERDHNALKRFSVLVVHRRGGKTVMAIMTLIHSALTTLKKDARFAYIAPQRNQAKDVAWKHLKNYALKIPHIKINESELWIELPNGAHIRLYGADNPDSLRGLYFDGVVLDEVADMHPDVWGEIIRPALSDRLGWAMFIGTPKGINLFSELYYGALGKPDWFADRLTVYDTKALPESEINALKDGMSENQFAQEYLCDFAAGNESALISMALIEEAVKRNAALKKEHYQSAPVVLGVDVARQGDDCSAIVRRQGLAMFDPIIMRGLDSMNVAGRVAKEIQEHSPDAVFIDGSGGYGAGVIDRLRQIGHRVTEVQFGGKPLDDRFLNKRCEMWWAVAEWLKQGGVIPNHPTLKLDLSGPTYSHAGISGKMSLESKDDLKARGLPSPDVGDALACTFAFTAHRRADHESMKMGKGSVYRVITDDDRDE